MPPRLLGPRQSPPFLARSRLRSSAR
jgi:hypothetical protein